MVVANEAQPQEGLAVDATIDRERLNIERVRSAVIVGLFLLVAGCGDSSKDGRDLSTDPACPAGYMDNAPAVPCNVLGQHCTGYENGAYCVGCAPGSYHWETDQIALVCDGGISDGG